MGTEDRLGVLVQGTKAGVVVVFELLAREIDRETELELGSKSGDVVQIVVSWIRRSQRRISSSTIWAGVVTPPGTSTTSHAGVCSSVWLTPRRRTPPSTGSGPICLPTNRISASGRRENTSQGPTASRAVTPG